MFQSIDSNGRLVHVSNMWLAILGYTRNEVIGRLWADFLDDASREYAVAQVIPELFRVGFCNDIEYRVLRSDGSIMDVLLSSVIEKRVPTAANRSLTVMHDISAEKRLRAVVSAHDELWRVTLHSKGDGVIRTDANGRVDYLYPTAEKLTGWTNEAAYGQPVEVIFNVVHWQTRRRVRSPVAQCLSEDCAISLADQTILLSRDYREYSVRDSASRIKDDSGRTVGVVLVFCDISEHRRLNQEIRYRATHDAMTGLYNRDEFERRLKAMLADSCDMKGEHALLYIDLDEFKVVNDAAGHAAGDQFLKQIALIVQGMARNTDTAARLCGDEFALVVANRSIEGAQETAQQLCERIDAFRFRFDDQSFHVGASVGLVPIDGRWSDVESILRAADGACFAAKESGRNRFHTYVATDQLIGSHRQALRWVRRVEQALDRNGFVLRWQRIMPLTAVNEGTHCGILIRMIDEDGGLVAPGVFLPSAEQFGIASRIDRWVIRTMLRWMEDNRAKLGHVSTVSINLSGRSVGDPDFHQDVERLLREFSVDTAKLCFEVTETTAITNILEATAILRIDAPP